MEVIYRKAEDRGSFENTWLKAKYSFSFAYYYDKNWLNFGDLIVLNDDIIKPGLGFPLHSHKNIEIITYYIATNDASHKTNLGEIEYSNSGDILYTSTGSGVQHEHGFENNTADSRLLQIWLNPNQLNTEPSSSKINLSKADKLNKLALIAYQDDSDTIITIKQDLCLYTTVLQQNKEVVLKTKKGRRYWVQVISGSIYLDNNTYKHGDGVGILKTQQDLIFLGKDTESEFLIFDLLD